MLCKFLPEIFGCAEPGRRAERCGDNEQPYTEGNILARILDQLLDVLRGEKEEHHGHAEKRQIDRT